MTILELLISQGICPIVGLLDRMVVLFLVFKGTSMLFSIVAVSIYIHTNSARGIPFSTPPPAFIVSRFFDDGHCDRCEKISHCKFDLHFSND